MLKVTRLIVLGIAVLSLNSCLYKTGLEDGKRDGIKKANKDVEEEYKPKLAKLQSELNSVKKTSENTLATMKDAHTSDIKSINSEHKRKTDEMQSEHDRNIEVTRQTSYDSGQSVMKGRFDETYDLGVTNKLKPTGWNDTVDSRK